MLVLFDQGTPVPIRPFLKEHTVQTTAQRGWDKLKNGELLKAAEDAGFDVLVTPQQKYPLPAEFDGSHDRARRAGQSAMANTAPACGACRHCRERGEAGQLHGSRNTRTLILAQKGAAAPFLVRLLRRSALGFHSKLSIPRLRLVQLVRIPHCHGQFSPPRQKDLAHTRIYTRVYKGCLSTSTKCAFSIQVDLRPEPLHAKTYRYRSAQPGQLPVCRPLAQNASFLAFHTANLDGWLLAQNLVSVLRRTGSADSAEPSRSSCTERPGCSKAAKWSPFFSSLSPLRRAFGRRLLQRRTP